MPRSDKTPVHDTTELLLRTFAFLAADGIADRSILRTKADDGRMRVLVTAGWARCSGEGADLAEALKGALDAYDAE